MGLVGRVGLVIPFWMLDTRRCSSSRCSSIVCVYKSGERVLVYITKKTLDYGMDRIDCKKSCKFRDRSGLPKE